MTRTILVVDDTETCAATLEVALAEIPEVDVSLASTVAEALRILCREHPAVDAVVTDLNLPSIDGFELIRTIRADPRHARVPIIVTSADPDPRTPGPYLRPGRRCVLRQALLARAGQAESGAASECEPKCSNP